MIDLTQRRSREVLRAQRVFAAIAARDPFGRIKLGRELDRGNPYAHAMLTRRGLVYDRGAIRKETP